MRQHRSSLVLLCFAGVLALLVTALPAPAGGCGYSSSYSYGYSYYQPYAPAYYAPPVYKNYTVFETVPVYAVGVYAGYVPPPAQTTTAPTPSTETCETKFNAFKEAMNVKLSALEARLLGAGPSSTPGGYAPEREHAAPPVRREQPPPMEPVNGSAKSSPPQTLPPGKYAAFNAECMSCHAPNTAKEKAEGHAFVTPLSPDGVNKSLKRMMAGTMPPPDHGKLSDKRFTQIMGELLGVTPGGDK